VALTPRVTVRVDDPLLSAARDGSGLPAGASPTELVRFALAKLAGWPDPHAAARGRPVGRPRKQPS
jgi:hypothetical protein